MIIFRTATNDYHSVRKIKEGVGIHINTQIFFFFFLFFFKSSGGWVKESLSSHTCTYQIHVFRFNPCSISSSHSRQSGATRIDKKRARLIGLIRLLQHNKKCRYLVPIDVFVYSAINSVERTQSQIINPAGASNHLM